ncbi:MAG TPA: HAMP domain-containing sensor histidine kinase [Phycisphaerae bacterium]|nr:HAMP domain-containing sensor histidine kinase [Phycisphaerae bacterium]
MSQTSIQEAPDAQTGPAVSKLAAKMAHELNNPLDAVLRFVSLAQRKAKSGDYGDIERYLADAQFGLQRMTEVLRELMDIGRETNDILNRSTATPLADLVAGAIRTAAAQAEQKRVTLIVKNLLPESVVPAYDLRLSQVLSNLMKNAVEASPEGGNVRLTVSLQRGEVPRDSIAGLGGERLVIRVEDSGPGVPAELLPNLFGAFVTTKSKGSGLGLGLAISRELVLSMDGTLTLENREGAGCVATILLPARGK